MVKELNVFTKGNSLDINCWSNVPYCFTRELESRGIVVNRVDINPSRGLNRIYDRTWLRLLRLLFPKTDYSYTRGLIHYLDVRRRVKRALRQFPGADANVFITFGFSAAGLTPKPTVLFYDWPYQYYFHYHFQKEPDLLERRAINRETIEIQRADLAVTLHPGVLEYMKNRYRTKNLRYFGNVVNAIQPPDKNEILPRKATSQCLLFIGRKKYAEGAKLLIQAYSELRKQFPELSLHIVGMTRDAIEDAPKEVQFYGYLSKAVPGQQEIYYRLLKSAKVMVIASPRWGGIQAMLEAMHFYVPIVALPYKECVSMFGEVVDFGFYFQEGSAESLCRQLRAVLEHPSYETLCLNAHEAVKSHTWPSFVDQLIGQIDRLAGRKEEDLVTIGGDVRV